MNLLEYPSIDLFHDGGRRRPDFDGDWHELDLVTCIQHPECGPYGDTVTCTMHVHGPLPVKIRWRCLSTSMMSHLGLYINDVCPFPMLLNSFQPCLYRPLKRTSAFIQLRPLSPTPSTRRKPVVMLTEKYLFIFAISLVHFWMFLRLRYMAW